MTDYVIRRLEDGVALEVDGQRVKTYIDHVEVRRGFGLPVQIKIFGLSGYTTQELEPFVDTLRYEGWGHDG